MKRVMNIIIALLVAVPLFSQQDNSSLNSRGTDKPIKTIFNSHSGNGAYGALSMGYSQIGGRDAIILGGRGEWVIGHGLGLGFGGYGFINDPELNLAENQYYSLSGGYGGFILEPIIMGRWPVHISLPLLLGVGGVARTSFSEIVFTHGEAYNAYLEEASVFLLAEPGLELEFNILPWMRMAVFGSYRISNNLIMIDVRPDALRGWNTGLTMKIGVF
jgi:hypothetical protein